MIERNNWNFAKENQVIKIKIKIVGEKLEWKMSVERGHREQSDAMVEMISRNDFNLFKVAY